MDSSGSLDAALHRFASPPDAHALDAWARMSPPLPGSTNGRRLFALGASRTVAIAAGSFGLRVTTTTAACDEPELDALLARIRAQLP